MGSRGTIAHDSCPGTSAGTWVLIGVGLPTRVEAWAQVAGLLATAWVVWVTFVAPSRADLAFRVVSALVIAFCASIWSIIMGLTLLLALRVLIPLSVFPAP